MDTITITQLKVFAHHGVYEQETINGQDFYINAELRLDLDDAGESDALEKTVNYGKVCDEIVSAMQNNTFRLLEAAARHTILHLFSSFPLLKGIKLEICKPQAPIAHPFGNVSVTMERMWHTAFVALGSNIGDKQHYIEEAVAALAGHEECRVKRVSSLITTPPYGGVAQDDFLNGVLELQTLMTPHRLLDLLHEMEKRAGRERLVHWGPRTLDLDILFYDQQVVDSEKLHIPHMDMANRYFVLKPLCEIAPYVRHPLTGLTVEEMLHRLVNTRTVTKRP